jgi:hypothetical protein
MLILSLTHFGRIAKAISIVEVMTALAARWKDQPDSDQHKGNEAQGLQLVTGHKSFSYSCWSVRGMRWFRGALYSARSFICCLDNGKIMSVAIMLYPQRSA